MKVILQRKFVTSLSIECLLALLILAAFGAKPSKIYAQKLGPNETATVRGKIERQGRSAKYPAAYIKVSLAPKALKDRRINTFTGVDGMYYFNVKSGDYILEIRTTQDKLIKSFNIKVNLKYVDIAPILIP